MKDPIFTAAPSSPVSVVEGESVTLTWRYNLSGETHQLTLFTTDGIFFIVQKFLEQSPKIEDSYSGRITANITDTYSSFTFLSVDRGDNKTYRLNVQSTGGDNSSSVVLVVKCKYDMIPGVSFNFFSALIT